MVCHWLFRLFRLFRGRIIYRSDKLNRWKSHPRDHPLPLIFFHASLATLFRDSTPRRDGSLGDAKKITVDRLPDVKSAPADEPPRRKLAD